MRGCFFYVDAVSCIPLTHVLLSLSLLSYLRFAHSHIFSYSLLFQATWKVKSYQSLAAIGGQNLPPSANVGSKDFVSNLYSNMPVKNILVANNLKGVSFLKVTETQILNVSDTTFTYELYYLLTNRKVPKSQQLNYSQKLPFVLHVPIPDIILDLVL